jgi:large conductance mechanosensitive channel
LEVGSKDSIFQIEFTDLREIIGESIMLKEFMDFLKQYGVIGLAIAVIIGGKLNALIGATVDGILMPVITFFIPGGAWRTATLDVGPFHFLLGPFFGAAIDFLIVAWIVFYFAKKILREEKVAKK